MKKSQSKSTLRKKADTLASKAAFKKWGDICTVCGRPATASHHFFPKSGSAYLRYNLNNLVPLCYGCHIIKIHTQGDPETIQTIIDSRGQDWYQELKALKKKGLEAKSLNTITHYKEIIKTLEDYLK